MPEVGTGPDEEEAGSTAGEEWWSLWFEPPKAFAARCQEAIDAEAEKRGTPAFVPHVTLVGGFRGTEDAARKSSATLAEALAAPEGPLFWGAECAVRGAESATTFFQCVYLAVVPSAPLTKAAEIARQHVGLEPAPYVPHLSLVYGDLSTEDRDQLVASHAPLAAELAEGFVASAVSLWRTDVNDRTCQKWERVATFKLQ